MPPKLKLALAVPVDEDPENGPGYGGSHASHGGGGDVMVSWQALQQVHISAGSKIEPVQRRWECQRWLKGCKSGKCAFSGFSAPEQRWHHSPDQLIQPLLIYV